VDGAFATESRHPALDDPMTGRGRAASARSSISSLQSGHRYLASR